MLFGLAYANLKLEPLEDLGNLPLGAYLAALGLEKMLNLNQSLLGLLKEDFSLLNHLLLAVGLLEEERQRPGSQVLTVKMHINLEVALI